MIIHGSSHCSVSVRPPLMTVNMPRKCVINIHKFLWLLMLKWKLCWGPGTFCTLSSQPTLPCSRVGGADLTTSRETWFCCVWIWTVKLQHGTYECVSVCPTDTSALDNSPLLCIVIELFTSVDFPPKSVYFSIRQYLAIDIYVLYMYAYTFTLFRYRYMYPIHRRTRCCWIPVMFRYV